MAHHPTKPSREPGRDQEWVLRGGVPPPLHSMLCPPLLCHPPARSARQGASLPSPPAQLGQSPGTGVTCSQSLSPGPEQAGAAGAGRAASHRRGCWQLARWEPFSGSGAKGETGTLNKADTKGLKKVEHRPFSSSGQDRPRMEGLPLPQERERRTVTKPALLG